MVRQERAVRTRQALLDAAAEEFDRHGYEGTSLNRVCRAAGITIGALTFHFSTKAELADAVQSQGRIITRAALDSMPPARLPRFTVPSTSCSNSPGYWRRSRPCAPRPG